MTRFGIARGRGGIAGVAVAPLAVAAAATAFLGTALPPAYGQKQEAQAAAKQGSRNKKPAPSRQQAGRVPAALVGSWTWGSVNPGRYVDKRTGEYVGHAGGGAISYTFGKDGSYKRYVLIHFGAGFSNESTFSAMEGTVDFDEAAGTFTIRMRKGTITFEKRSGMTKRPLSREDMERSGTVFTYRLDKDETGRTVLLVNDKDKPASEGRHFVKDTEGKS
jgi:hypothetical protein